MKPTILDLVYDGNYVGRIKGFIIYEYRGDLFAITKITDSVIILPKYITYSELSDALVAA